MYWQDFERLVVSICDRILGTGTIHFSDGPDGGRDAAFTGRAENYPSSTKPWEGSFVIQAKHCKNPNAYAHSYITCILIAISGEVSNG